MNEYQQVVIRILSLSPAPLGSRFAHRDLENKGHVYYQPVYFVALCEVEDRVCGQPEQHPQEWATVTEPDGTPRRDTAILPCVQSDFRAPWFEPCVVDAFGHTEGGPVFLMPGEELSSEEIADLTAVRLPPVPGNPNN